MDYYKAYKVENDIPPSEIGDNEGLGHGSQPIAFGLGLGRRNTVEVNHQGLLTAMRNKGISAISEQIEEVFLLVFKGFFF